jgi:hypothetical protein
MKIQNVASLWAAAAKSFELFGLEPAKRQNSMTPRDSTMKIYEDL